MSGFPRLIPAFTARISISPPSHVGSLRSGSQTHVAILPDTGFLQSEPGYPIQVDAIFVHGSDYIRADPDGQHVRLEVSSLLKDKSGGFIRYSYTGTVRMDGQAAKVLSGDAGAVTTDFGEAFTNISFETGSAGLKDLEKKVYVGSGRFILEEGKPATVEYKISEVAH